MQSVSPEPEMESFLLRHVPKLDSQWEGASEDDIRAIEELAGQPLPRFYQWFLSRMGGSPGHLVRFKNFTASAVLSNYRQGLAESEAGLLQIAIEPDDVMPTAVYYDLNRPVRDDAVVMVGAADGGDLEDDFETFREMMGWYTLNAHGIDSAEQHCKGIIRGSDVSEQLGQVLANVGFDNPIPTGPYCCIAERSDAAMIGVVSPYERNKGFLIFRLGGKDVGSLRRILDLTSLARGTGLVGTHVCAVRRRDALRIEVVDVRLGEITAKPAASACFVRWIGPIEQSHAGSASWPSLGESLRPILMIQSKDYRQLGAAGAGLVVELFGDTFGCDKHLHRFFSNL